MMYEDNLDTVLDQLPATPPRRHHGGLRGNLLGVHGNPLVTYEGEDSQCSTPPVFSSPRVLPKICATGGLLDPIEEGEGSCGSSQEDLAGMEGRGGMQGRGSPHTHRDNNPDTDCHIYENSPTQPVDSVEGSTCMDVHNRHSPRQGRKQLRSPLRKVKPAKGSWGSLDRQSMGSRDKQNSGSLDRQTMGSLTRHGSLDRNASSSLDRQIAGSLDRQTKRKRVLMKGCSLDERRKPRPTPTLSPPVDPRGWYSDSDTSNIPRRKPHRNLLLGHEAALACSSPTPLQGHPMSKAHKRSLQTPQGRGPQGRSPQGQEVKRVQCTEEHGHGSQEVIFPEKQEVLDSRKYMIQHGNNLRVDRPRGRSLSPRLGVRAPPNPSGSPHIPQRSLSHQPGSPHIPQRSLPQHPDMPQRPVLPPGSTNHPQRSLMQPGSADLVPRPVPEVGLFQGQQRPPLHYPGSPPVPRPRRKDPRHDSGCHSDGESMDGGATPRCFRRGMCRHHAGNHRGLDLPTHPPKLGSRPPTVTPQGAQSPGLPDICVTDTSLTGVAMSQSYTPGVTPRPTTPQPPTSPRPGQKVRRSQSCREAHLFGVKPSTGDKEGKENKGKDEGKKGRGKKGPKYGRHSLPRNNKLGTKPKKLGTPGFHVSKYRPLSNPRPLSAPQGGSLPRPDTPGSHGNPVMGGGGEGRFHPCPLHRNALGVGRTRSLTALNHHSVLVHHNNMLSNITNHHSNTSKHHSNKNISHSNHKVKDKHQQQSGRSESDPQVKYICDISVDTWVPVHVHVHLVM